MTRTDIQGVQDSYAQLVPFLEKAGQLFLHRLFRLAPDCRSLCSDAVALRRPLIDMFDLAVRNLRHPDRILYAVQQTGHQLAVLGMSEAHYVAAEEALLWTLETCLIDRFPPELRKSWAQAFALYVQVLKQSGAKALLARVA